MKDSTLIFGLTSSELRPILEQAVGSPIAGFTIAFDRQIRGHFGYEAEKVLPTFHYETQSGKKGTLTMFVKRFRHPGRVESPHYENLGSCGAPIPRLYGVRHDPEGREIVFTEYIEAEHDVHPFAHVINDDKSFYPVLEMAARFNTLRPGQDYLDGLTNRDFGQDRKRLLDSLFTVWGHAAHGELGEELEHLCASNADAPERIADRSEGLEIHIKQMETGLLHGEFFPDHVGWRLGTGEMVCTDLSSVCLGPRFSDVAWYVGPPEAFQLHPRPRETMAKYYLPAYERYGGPTVPVGVFLDETAVLWSAEAMRVGGELSVSLHGRIDWTYNQENAREIYRGELIRKIRYLLSLVG